MTYHNNPLEFCMTMQESIAWDDARYWHNDNAVRDVLKQLDFAIVGGAFMCDQWTLLADVIGAVEDELDAIRTEAIRGNDGYEDGLDDVAMKACDVIEQYGDAKLAEIVS